MPPYDLATVQWIDTAPHAGGAEQVTLVLRRPTEGGHLALGALLLSSHAFAAWFRAEPIVGEEWRLPAPERAEPPT